MKRFSKEHRRAIVLVVFSFTILGVYFQNCSKVNFKNMPAELEQTSQAPGPGASKVTVGMDGLSDLKMFFVVDNSYTMKENNINLASSFSSLFNSQNSDNLNHFQVSNYILSVAQKVPVSATDPNDPSRLNQLLSWQLNPSALSPADLTIDRSADLLGKIAGDSIGYAIASTPASISFSPAFVLGLSKDGQVTSEILKPASSSSDQMVHDFQNRLAVLQNVSDSNYQANKDIMDQESGLCAVARILRNPEKYLKPGDFPILNIFTDEDDADSAGKSCIASFTLADGKENLIDGQCESRSTNLSYQYNKCDINYQDYFSWKMTYKIPQPFSTLTYYPTYGYTCPQTEVNYQLVTAWKRQQTSIAITYHTYSILDGVQVVDPTAKFKTVAVTGFKSDSECTTLAKNNLNVFTEVYVSSACTQSTVDVASGVCNSWDPTCVPASTSPRTAQVAGDVTASGACASAAQTAAGFASQNYLIGSASCRLLGTTVNSSSNGTGCTQNIAANPITVTDIRGDLSSQISCDSEARNRNGLVSAQYPAVCQLAYTSFNTQDRNGVLRLKDFPGTVSGVCPQAIKDKVASLTNVDPAAIVSCSIDPIVTATASPTLRLADCGKEAEQFCSAHPEYFNCKLSDKTPAEGIVMTQNNFLEEELGCQSKCQDSRMNFCKPTANLASVDPQMSVSDYIAQAFQGRNCVSPPSASSVYSSFQAKLESQKASLCPDKDPRWNYPIYTRINRTYVMKGLIPEYVAGNEFVPGNAYVPDQIRPKVDLITYIQQRSAELFGAQKPILNVFIRTASDPLGDAGSRGVAYEKLAQAMGGQVNSVLKPDYSPTLMQLSSLIRSRTIRSFKVPNMQDTQQIKSVKWTSKGVTQDLAPESWTQTGQTVRISDDISLEVGDEIQFEFE